MSMERAPQAEPETVITLQRPLKSDEKLADLYRTITCPESAAIVWPVRVRALSGHKKTTESAMSWPVISRLSGSLIY